jgi:hypothetical protein
MRSSTPVRLPTLTLRAALGIVALLIGVTPWTWADHVALWKTHRARAADLISDRDRTGYGGLRCGGSCCSRQDRAAERTSISERDGRHGNETGIKLACVKRAVIPVGDWSIAMTRACFEPASFFFSRSVMAGAFAVIARAVVDLGECFFADFGIGILHSVMAALRRATTEAPPRPTWPLVAGGFDQDPRRHLFCPVRP